MTGHRCCGRVLPLLVAVGAYAGLAANAVAQDSVATDRAALEALYDATGGQTWTSSTNWKTDAPLGEWHGVSTDASGRVRRLNLDSNSLAGPIPADLGNLSRLQSMFLGTNELTGPIPVTLGSLSNLESLSLSDNALTGPIPAAWASLSNLTLLSLGTNELTGPIPVTLGSLSNLESLSLGGNALTGPIPAALGSLTNLIILSLDSNELTGPIPAALGSLSSLESLSLGSNELTGPIPVALGSLSNLTLLDLQANNLTGPIPAVLGSLSGLTSLDLRANNLSGQIPPALGSLSSLEALSLGGNRLAGPVPAWLGSLSSLSSLSLGGNALTGMVPTSLGSLSNLASLALDSNDLTGPIPAALGSLSSLEALSLTRNNLTGPVPAELTQLSALRVLEIGRTGLCVPAASPFVEWLETMERFAGPTCNRPPEAVGTIPAPTLAASGTALSVPLADYFRDPDNDVLRFAATSSDATTLAASVSGSTAWLAPRTAGTATLAVTASDPGGLRATRAITVTVVTSAAPQSDRAALAALYDETDGPSWTNSTNWKTAAPLGQWNGVTTDAAGRVTKLELRENALAGPIPAALGSLSSLEALDLGRNALTGPIPAILGSLSNLESLDLGANQLTGPIPAQLGSLTSLSALSLDRNKLTGSVPTALGSLSSLKSLNLGQNIFTGPIPAALGSLSGLTRLHLGGNALTGPIPADLASLSRLESLDLGRNVLAGPIPAALGSLSSLQALDLSYSWGLSGPLPDSLRLPSLRQLDIWATQACAPSAWQDWLQTNDFAGSPCGTETEVTIDVAIIYTPAARDAAGGSAAIEAVIDLMIAETNEAYAVSGVHHRVALVARSEVAYAETGDSALDLGRLENPSDGHMDAVHTLRNQTGADLAHLIFDEGDASGLATLGGPFGLTCLRCGSETFARQTGHNMGLLPDRYTVQESAGTLSPHPAHGYVNQKTFEAGTTPSRRWRTIMADGRQCTDANRTCRQLLRFSNSRQTWLDDPLGVAFDTDASGVSGPADAVAVLNATGPAVAAWRERIPSAGNQPPSAVGELTDMQVPALDGTVAVDVSEGFVDPDGDTLSYTVLSASPEVATAQADGAGVTLTAVGIGTARVRVTAADPGGLTATQSFMVTVPGAVTDSRDSDREALAALYDAAGGPAWKNGTNWKTEAPLGEWHGVTADSDGRVIGLSLTSNDLSGPIPAALGDLSRLEQLDLRRNRLSGPIPATLASLPNLEQLDLERNALTGAIPEGLGGLSNLERLVLRRNSLYGPVPVALGNLSNLTVLDLSENALTGPVPEALGGLSNLDRLALGRNDFSGPVPGALGSLSQLTWLDLGENWNLSGSLPAGLRLPGLRRLDIWRTQTCAPAAWQDWVQTISFFGVRCTQAEEAVTVDVAVFYTQGARARAGGTAAIEAVIDLMIAETNQAYETSGVRHRVALVARSEVQYTETGNTSLDLFRLLEPSDGHMDEVHAIRDSVGADLVHLLLDLADFSGKAYDSGFVGVTCGRCGGRIFAHELGHNMGLFHDRYYEQSQGMRLSPHPMYGYVNQRAFDEGAAPASRWRTIMSYNGQCRDAGVGRCRRLLRFSNPRQELRGDPLGVPANAGASGATGPADAVAILNAMLPAVADRRHRVTDEADPPQPAVAPQRGSLAEDVSAGPVDRAGDALGRTAHIEGSGPARTDTAGPTATPPPVGTVPGQAHSRRDAGSSLRADRQPRPFARAPEGAR